MLRRVPLGISLSELPEYFRGRDHEVEEDAWYGLLASFPVTE